MEGKIKQSKEQYFLELLLGNSRVDIPGVWGITAKSLQSKLVKWKMPTLLEEDIALEEYRKSLPKQAETIETLNATDQVDSEPPMQIAKKELHLWLKIPVVNVGGSIYEHRDILKLKIDELAKEVVFGQGRSQLVAKGLEVMFALTSVLYLDANELLKSEYQTKQNLVRLMIKVNKEHLTVIKRRSELRGWKAISE